MGWGVMNFMLLAEFFVVPSKTWNLEKKRSLVQDFRPKHPTKGVLYNRAAKVCINLNRL